MECNVLLLYVSSSKELFFLSFAFRLLEEQDGCWLLEVELFPMADCKLTENRYGHSLPSQTKLVLYILRPHSTSVVLYAKTTRRTKVKSFQLCAYVRSRLLRFKQKIALVKWSGAFKKPPVREP